MTIQYLHVRLTPTVRGRNVIAVNKGSSQQAFETISVGRESSALFTKIAVSRWDEARLARRFSRFVAGFVTRPGK